MREREHLEKTAPKRIDRELTELLQAERERGGERERERESTFSKSEWIMT